MSDDPQPAARVDDAVQHSQARIGRGLGALGGAALALGVLVLAGALEVGTAGLATPVVIGLGALAIGGIGAAMSAGSNLGADEGRKFVHDDGAIASGFPTVLVGPDRKPLAHVNSNANCNDHKHLSGGSCSDAVNGAQEQIAEGSGTVLVGPGLLPVARVGSQGTCEFTVGHGSPTVIIGGPTLRLLKVGSGDDPDKGFFDGVGTVSGVLGIAGAALVLWPATLTLAGVGIMGAGGAGAWLVGKGVGKGLEYLPEGEVRDAASLALAVLPLAGLPKMARGLSRTEGLGRAKGESEEGFTSRVQAAKNARLEAEWRTRVQASKPRAGEIPLGPDGRPILAYARASGAARALFDDGGGVFRKKGGDVMQMTAEDAAGGSIPKSPQEVSKANYDQAAQAKLDLPNRLDPDDVRTVASAGGKDYLSGWEGKRPRKLPASYDSVSPEDVKAHSDKIGHTLAKGSADDQIRNGGFEGKGKASHAEKQALLGSGGESPGVSKDMCGDCQNFFKQDAIYNNRTNYNTDPNGQWKFEPDGTITRPDGETISPNDKINQSSYGNVTRQDGTTLPAIPLSGK